MASPVFGAYKTRWKNGNSSLEESNPLKTLNQPTALQYWANIRWLTYQVANSLALVTEADKILQTEYMKMIQNSGEITDRGKAMLRLLKANKHYEH